MIDSLQRHLTLFPALFPSIFMLCLGLTLVVFSACGSDTYTGTGTDDNSNGNSSVGDDTYSGQNGSGSSTATDTWDNFGEQFFVDYCVACHSTGDRNYTNMTDIIRDTAKIRCGTSDVILNGCGSWPPAGQFPIGNGAMPSNLERQRLIAWIDAGMAVQ